jgi:hypothetical protein
VPRRALARFGRRRREPAAAVGGKPHGHSLDREQRDRADATGSAAEKDPGELSCELHQQHHGDAALDLRTAHARQQRIARRDDESVERADGKPVQRHRKKIDPARCQHQQKRERRQDEQDLQTHQQASAVAAVRDRSAEQQKHQQRQIQQRLREADPPGRLPEGDGQPPSEQYALNSEG